ncbi:hypothetical protein AVEN_255596-1 [Araneus ventricosus]|uniref:Uncharacterized protein n=1 Tax=Araneus ventricosus TaxID=182803 RepID=A0A4Y2QTF7_ARAVE|nr:hypothetical protein AVEN_255596-1 [Araneus ventricosus]
MPTLGLLAPPFQIFAPHQREDIRPTMADLMCTRSTYAADDGSKLDGTVGAAFHVIEGTRTADFQFRLEDRNSVFQAELSALR